jgi:hypothetical protein
MRHLTDILCWVIILPCFCFVLVSCAFVPHLYICVFMYIFVYWSSKWLWAAKPHVNKLDWIILNYDVPVYSRTSDLFSQFLLWQLQCYFRCLLPDEICCYYLFPLCLRFWYVTWCIFLTSLCWPCNCPCGSYTCTLITTIWIALNWTKLAYYEQY